MEVVELVFEDGVEAEWVSFGEVLKAVGEGLGRRATPVLEAEPDAADLGEAPISGAEVEVTGPDLGDSVEPEDALCCCSKAGDDGPLLFAVACKILRFSSLMILSLSSLHCLSLACRSLS